MMGGSGRPPEGNLVHDLKANILVAAIAQDLVDAAVLRASLQKELQRLDEIPLGFFSGFSDGP